MDGSSYLILLPSLSLPHVQWPLRQLAQKGGLKKHSSQGTCTRPIKPSSSLFLPPLKKKEIHVRTGSHTDGLLCRRSESLSFVMLPLTIGICTGGSSVDVIDSFSGTLLLLCAGSSLGC